MSIKLPELISVCEIVSPLPEENPLMLGEEAMAFHEKADPDTGEESVINVVSPEQKDMLTGFAMASGRGNTEI